MNAATGAEAGTSPAGEQALRFAMLSVYYNCLGREGSSAGAPAILLPLPGGPLGLADALAVVEKARPPAMRAAAMRAAAWRIVRATPAGGDYPRELESALAEFNSSLKLRKLKTLRKAYRGAANLVGAALVACAEGLPEFKDLRAQLKSVKPGRDATKAVLGVTAFDFLNGPDPATELRLLRDEVGLDLYQYAAELADVAAFDAWWQAASPAQNDGPGTMTVYPAASVIQQDLRTMITRVTATSLVRCDDFSTLVRWADPQCWWWASEVMKDTRYVNDCYDLDPRPVREGQGYESGKPPPYRWLEENVNVPALNGQGDSSFHNVLRIDRFSVDQKRQTVTVKFSLGRCIESTVLWDTRAGGILVDQGYILVRPLTQDRWRLTSHKTLLFSDRTPNMSTTGWFDVGQMLNVLCPAALSWWMESETYSAAHPAYSPRSNGASDGGSE